MSKRGAYSRARISSSEARRYVLARMRALRYIDADTQRRRSVACCGLVTGL
jgi:hypothetical protein